MMLTWGVSRPTTSGRATLLRSRSSRSGSRFIEHLNFGGSVAGALPCVAERRIACVFVAVNRDKRPRLRKLPSRSCFYQRGFRDGRTWITRALIPTEFSRARLRAPVLAKSVCFLFQDPRLLLCETQSRGS